MLETPTILRNDKEALGTISTSSLPWYVVGVTSVSDLHQRQHISKVSDEPPLKRRRSDEDTPKRRYQRRNSQTASMLFASVSKVSFHDEEFLASSVEESVTGDISTQLHGEGGSSVPT